MLSCFMVSETKVSELQQRSGSCSADPSGNGGGTLHSLAMTPEASKHAWVCFRETQVSFIAVSGVNEPSR